MKKLLLTLFGALLALPAMAYDGDYFSYTYEGQTLTYTVIDEAAKTVRTEAGLDENGDINTSGVLIIPSTAINNGISYTVAEIGDYAFAQCSRLTSVTIPNSVTEIGKRAFISCTGLTSIVVPESVTTIGSGAFYSCRGLASIVVPESVTTIGSDAFTDCRGLTKAEFASIEHLCAINFGGSGANPLYYAHNLYINGEEVTQVVIPNSVTKIGDYTFEGCAGLTSIVIGDAVTSIGNEAFCDCSGLTSIIIGDAVTSIGNEAFYDCSGLTSVIIPHSVTEIGKNAFFGCYRLQKSAYPNTLSNPFGNGTTIAYNPEGAIIEDGWIYGPEKKEIRFAPWNLEGDYVIPENIESIGDDAFLGCSGLTSVTIGNSVTSIGDRAFLGCSGLTSVIIPPSVTSIGDYAFDECFGLKKAGYPNTLDYKFSYETRVAYNPEGAIIEDGWIYGPEKKEILFVPLDIEGDYVITETIESIGDYAFLNCSGLTSVTIGNSVTSIGDRAFLGCSGLTSVIISPSVTELADYAFLGCSGLKKAGYPNTLEYPRYSFSYEIAVAYNPEDAIIEDGWVYGPEKKEIRFAPWNLEGDYVIPENIESIGEYAFQGCTGLTSVTIGNSVTTIGDFAFKNCTDLTSAYIGESVTKIEYAVFFDCLNLTEIEVKAIVPPILINNSFLIHYEETHYDTATATIPRESAEEYLVSSWAMFKNLRLSGSETTIQSTSDAAINYYLIPGAKAEDKNLAIVKPGNYSGEITIPERFTYTDSAGNNTRYYVREIGYQAFKDANITKVNFHSRIDLKAIGGEAFYNCKNLTSIEIPKTVTEIGSDAFSWCTGLTSINIPNSVTKIGPEAFAWCTGLGSVTLGESIAEIGEGAFLNIWSLNKAEFASIEHLCAISFEDYAANPLYFASYLYINGEEVTDVIIPDSVTEIGSYTFRGHSGMNSITIPYTVTSIGRGAFNSCRGLTEIIVDEENPAYSSEDGILFSKDKCTLIQYPIGNSQSQFEIPDFVAEISDCAFSECYSLNSVIIPNTVTRIGVSAFSLCGRLTTVLIGNSVAEIGDDAFYSCNELIKSAYPNSLSNPFSEGIAVAYNPEGSIIEDGWIYGPEKKEIRFAPWDIDWDFTIPNSITSIDDEAFTGCIWLEKIVISPSVKAIGESAFAGNSYLSSIIMGANVKTIGDKAFDGCPVEDVYITAQVPPTATNTTFTAYSAKLWLQDPGDNSVIEAYYDAFTCWDRFDSYAMIPATAITTEGEPIVTGKPGDKVQLTVTVAPADATLPHVFWSSTNPDVATVDVNGLVTILGVSGSDKRAVGEPCKIIAETLYADGPTLEFTVNSSEIVNIKEVNVEPNSTNTKGIAAIYNLRGVRVGTSTDGLPKGIYIVRDGSTTRKIAI